MIKINLIRLRDVEAIHGQHLEMIDLSGRLLGRLWHGYHLEFFDRVFFFFFFCLFCFFFLLIVFTMTMWYTHKSEAPN